MSDNAGRRLINCAEGVQSRYFKELTETIQRLTLDIKPVKSWRFQRHAEDVEKRRAR